jgi:hypothetical protein
MYPDFLLGLVESMSLMRLSLKKAANADMYRAAYRKSGVVLGCTFPPRPVPKGRLRITQDGSPG